MKEPADPQVLQRNGGHSTLLCPRHSAESCRFKSISHVQETQPAVRLAVTHNGKLICTHWEKEERCVSHLSLRLCCVTIECRAQGARTSLLLGCTNLAGLTGLRVASIHWSECYWLCKFCSVCLSASSRVESKARHMKGNSLGTQMLFRLSFVMLTAIVLLPEAGSASECMESTKPLSWPKQSGVPGS